MNNKMNTTIQRTMGECQIPNRLIIRWVAESKEAEFYAASYVAVNAGILRKEYGNQHLAFVKGRGVIDHDNDEIKLYDRISDLGVLNVHVGTIDELLRTEEEIATGGIEA